jgi:hypothetical protein
MLNLVLALLEFEKTNHEHALQSAFKLIYGSGVPQEEAK